MLIFLLKNLLKNHSVNLVQINIQNYKTKYAHFVLGSFESKLCLLDFKYRKTRATIDQRLQFRLKANFVKKDDKILKETRKQLDEYFNMKRKEFDIPFITVGTDFQKSVWDALLKIPYGDTLSYLQLSKNIDNAKATRAVANAVGANAISIIIPCRRVIGANGKLTGFSGGLELKKRLLILEKNLSSP